MSTHFQIPKSVVYIFVISLGLVLMLELAARAVEYVTPAAPSAATLDYVPTGVLSEADELLAEHRYWDRYMQHDPYRVFSPIPEWRGRFTHYNAFGFRGDPIDREKAPNRVRVAVLGGSTAFGAFVKDEQTFPSVLQTLLQGTSPNGRATGSRKKAEVFNAAVPGYVSTQELITLHLKVLPLNPDLVIIFDGLNDVFSLDSPVNDAWQMEKWESQCTMTMTQRVKPLLLHSSALLRFGQDLRQGIAHWTEKAGLHQDVVAKSEPRFDLYNERAKSYLENLRSMLSLLNARGIRGLAISQPTQLWSMSETEMARLTHIPITKVRAMRKLHDTLKQGMAEVVAQAGPNFSMLDLDDLGENPAMFLDEDYIHFTESGNREVARRIADFIADNSEYIGD